MHISKFVLLSLLTALSLAAPASYIQHEKRNILQHEARWIKRGKSPAETRMSVRIAIAQRNLEHGHKMLMDISDPSSPNFAKHMTSQEVAEFFSPAQESIDTISQWLTSAGIGAGRHTVSPGRSWIKFDASVEELETLIQTKYHTFTNKQTNREHIACDEYHVPHAIHHHIDFITPTIGMDAVLTERVSKRSNAAICRRSPVHPGASDAVESKTFVASNDTCYQGLTPACIQKAYGIPVSTSAQTGNELGIFETADFYNQEDLDLFWKNFTTIPSGTGPKVDSVDGGIAPQPECLSRTESLLDFEIAIPLIYPQATVLFQVDDALNVWKGFGNTFLDALDASYCTFDGGDDPKIDPTYPDTQSGGYDKPKMCGAHTPTNVISISYGFEETHLPLTYESRQCQEYMKLGLQGVSIIYASGDSGVGCADTNGTQFAPFFPATCPYVTSVGATQVNQGAAITDVESAASDPLNEFYSGGGFSNRFAAPSYQSSALATFFADHKPSYASSVYNASGRGFPDVSALGLNIININGGQQILQAGTSASAPIFASIITLINEQRLAAGKKPAGFLNPTLYANPSAFTDIVTGSNPGCGTDGFSAVTGWDPVTGLGTPIFSKLLNVFMALP